MVAPGGEAPIEMARLAPWRQLTVRPQDIGEALTPWLGPDLQNRVPLVRNPIGDGDMSIVPLRLGLQDRTHGC